jgi:hypothetical protein
MYFSAFIILIIESERVRLVENAACMGERRNAYRVLSVKRE